MVRFMRKIFLGYEQIAILWKLHLNEVALLNVIHHCLRLDHLGSHDFEILNQGVPAAAT